MKNNYQLINIDLYQFEIYRYVFAFSLLFKGMKL